MMRSKPAAFAKNSVFLWLFALLLLLTAPFSLASSTSTLQPNADGTVFDPKTGLTWMRCAMGKTWTGTTCSGTAATYTFDQANALTGAVPFAGQNDWRMPNIRELQTIVDRTVSYPAIDSVAFPDTPGSRFWSGSPNASYSGIAWYVDLGYGYSSGGGGRSDGYAVRLVRGGQSFSPLLGITRPTSDYVDNGNGTVTHTPTNLTWKRCSEGQAWTGSTCTGTASTYTFDQANALTGKTTFAGQSDWRVPTEDELVSLVDYSISIAYSGPKINSSFFPETPGSNFWSGSPLHSSPNSAWLVGFGFDGYAGGADYLGRSNGYAVRLVRGGTANMPALVCYAFDNNGLDSSGNGFNANTVGLTGVADRNGKADGAYYFSGQLPASGSSAYVSYASIPDNPVFHFSNALTVSAWVKPDITNGTRTILFKWYSPDSFGLTRIFHKT